MAGEIGIDAVTLVSIFVESVLYGLFIVLFVTSLYVLLRRKSSSDTVSKPMLSISITMFIVATIHIGVDLRRVLDAFLHATNSTGGPIAYLIQVNTVNFTLKNTSYCAQTLVGDGFVLYRLYLVWNGDKRAFLPALVCFVASIVGAIGALQACARAPPTEPIFSSELQKWIAPFFLLTLLTNFSCTSLIAARIWWMHRHSAGTAAGGGLLPAAIVIIESGAIYSVCLIILLSLYLARSFAQDIAIDAVTQVIGVVFSLIIVRVGLGLTSDTATSRSRPLFSTFITGSGQDSMFTGDMHPMHSMEMNMAKMRVGNGRQDDKDAFVISPSSSSPSQYDLQKYKDAEEFVVQDGDSALGRRPGV